MVCCGAAPAVVDESSASAAVVPAAASEVSPAPAPDPALAMAHKLYEEGSHAYNLGDFAAAITKFQAAYDLTRATELLYNIAQAYTRRFEIDPEPEHLRIARVLFGTFIKLREVNGQDPRDAAVRLEAIDLRLARLEAERREQERRAAELRAAAIRDMSYRPGKLGVAGYLALGGGLLAGSGLGTVGLVSAQRLDDQRVRESDLPLDAARRDAYQTQLDRAHALGYASIGVGAAFTVAGVVMVAVDAARGRRRGGRVSFGPRGLAVGF